ncbi:MAG: PD-(D/E)XK nuclease family protein [Betaproteobacteria bacterium]|jgi:ATP-dependent helicase/nuclease subunit B
MAPGAQFHAVQKRDLFARLAAGHSEGIAVVTPNRRLAQTLAREFDELQIASGLAVWEGADILPFGAFVERLYEDALYSDIAARLPLLLTGAQEQELWQAAIRASEWGASLLAVPRAAADCRKAWGLAHTWRIAGAVTADGGGFPGNEDAKAFAQWAREYAKRCVRDGNTDGACLADIVAPLLQEAALRKPKRLVAYAFDVMPPQMRDFLDACAGQGIEVCVSDPEGKEANASRVAFASAREELEAAAGWARAKLEAGAKRIGVVVPELGQRRREVARVFTRIMDPARNLPGAGRKTLPFNISLGAPLSDYPLAHAALRILELASGEIPFEQASKLVRSPFLAGSQSEMAPRARLDAGLRKLAPAHVTLGKLVALIDGTPMLRARLEALFALAREHPGGERSPHEWGRHCSALLEAAGFPGERNLDSGEFQTQAKFNETLAEFAKLERVAPAMSFAQALVRLRRICADTLFQPESPDAPIQVLGVLESAGLEFDALWVSGLTDEAWPLAASPNPFIPPALQRKAGIPEASAEATLARGRRITAGWFAAADEVVVSHPTMEADRTLQPSPLIADIPIKAPLTATRALYRDLIFAARRSETVADGRAPALATKTPRGGTRILSDQAACPFRAFARHRLAAQSLEEAVTGPDARVRGQLLHTLMKVLWSELKGSQGLQGDYAPAIERAAAAAVREAMLEEPFAGLERKRLAKLARDWLDVERGRPAFAVVATEEKRKLAVAGLELNGRIDRMDSLEAGGHALIDYKSGRPSPVEWLGERPDDPQLPLYALNATEDISVVAFAKLKTGEMRYMGFSDRKDLIPDVKPAKDWNALVAGWKKEIEALGAGFASGDARVDPKKQLATCRYCDLQPLCRVYERVNALTESEEVAND